MKMSSNSSKFISSKAFVVRIRQSFPSSKFPVLRYSKLLFNQYVLEHYKAGTNEVHLIFDQPACYFNPKQFEHVRRSKTKSNSNHEHLAFTPDTNISQGWKEYMNAEHANDQLLKLLDFHSYK